MRSFAEHLNAPSGKGALAEAPYTGAAGGAACGDIVRIALRIEGDRVVEAGFDAHGCGALTAAASATVELAEGGPFLDACRLGAADVAEALGDSHRRSATLRSSRPTRCTAPSVQLPRTARAGATGPCA